MPELKGRRVLIGTPVYDWKADVRYLNSFGQTQRLCEKLGIWFGWLFPPGKVVTEARNELLRDALKYNIDDLFFIDADQDWKPEDFVRVLGFDVDCVGVPILKKKDEIEWNLHVPEGIFSFQAHPTLDLLTAPDLKLGTGFIRFSRRALQALWDSSEKYKCPDGSEGAWAFDYRPLNGELVSEDTFVSKKLSGLGIRTWIDPTVTVGHVQGQKRYAKCFGEWLEEMQAIAMRQAA